MKRGQFGQLPRKSDIGPSSGGFWENYPNYPTVQHRMLALGFVFSARITPAIRATEDSRVGKEPSTQLRNTAGS